MNIVIVGEGKMGHTLAQRLIAEGHDITVIDRSENVLQRGRDTLDALFIQGNGVNADTLREAEAHHADILIAVTASDEINMLTSLIAKRLGTAYAIARIRDPEYLSSLPFLQQELYIDYAVNPERATAREISRMLRLPFAGNIETFAHGRAEMVDFRAASKDMVVGVPLRDLYKKYKHLPQVLFCAVERDGQAIIPKGDFVIRENDRVHVTGDANTITKFFDMLGKNTGEIRSVMVLGGSRIAYYLASMLLPMGIGMSIVEIDPAKARTLSEQLPDANIIVGDGTDHELLISEGLNDHDAFVTLTGRDEDNLMAGLYAAKNGSKKVIVKNNHDNYSQLMAGFGLDSIISPKAVTCNTILRTVRSRASRSSSAIERVYRLMDGQAEALEFIADAQENFIHVPLKDLVIAPDVLVAVIVRDGQVRIPFGNDAIEGGDHVIIISRKEGIRDLSEVLRRAHT